jgi:multidrug efflux pump subunit AcrB
MMSLAGLIVVPVNFLPLPNEGVLLESFTFDFGGLYPQLESAALGLLAAAIAAFLLMVAIMILQFDGLLVPGLLLLQIPLAFTIHTFWNGATRQSRSFILRRLQHHHGSALWNTMSVGDRP